MALVDNEDHATLATTAKLVGSRAFFEHKHVEEGGLPDTSEPDFMLSESFETEEMHLSEPLLSLSVPLDSATSAAFTVPNTTRWARRLCAPSVKAHRRRA